MAYWSDYYDFDDDEGGWSDYYTGLRYEADPSWIPPPRLQAPLPPPTYAPRLRRRTQHRDVALDKSTPPRLPPQPRAPTRRPATPVVERRTVAPAPDVTPVQLELQWLRCKVARLKAELVVTHPPIAPPAYASPAGSTAAAPGPLVSDSTVVPAAAPPSPSVIAPPPTPTTAPPPAPVVAPLSLTPEAALHTVVLVCISAPAPAIKPATEPASSLVIFEVQHARLRPDEMLLQHTAHVFSLTPPTSKQGRFDSKGRRVMRPCISPSRTQASPTRPRPWRPPWLKT